MLTPEFALFNLFFQPICTIILFAVNVYLYKMGISIINALKEMRFLTSNLSSIFLSFCLLLDFISWCTVIPEVIIIYKIVNDNYECKDHIKH